MDRSIRLIALDIDETLVGTDHRVSEANARAVAEAMARGVKVTLITGRRYALSAARYAEALGLAGPVGVHFGRRVVEHPGGKVLASYPLPPGSAKVLVETARAFPEATVSAFVGDDFRFERLPPGFDVSVVAQHSIGDLDEVIAARADEIMSLYISEPKGNGAALAVAEAARRLFPGLIEYHLEPWGKASEGLIEVLSAAADKGTALLDIARRLGVDPAETVAMGDSEADIPMLKAAGVGVAMPWSPEVVRRAADLVAEGKPENAVARAIEALLSRGR